MTSVAIIGSGISGLTCGYGLSDHYEVDIYEASSSIGGHTHTVKIDGLAIDSGFIVFNGRTYPFFKKMLDDLGILYRPTEMSFSVRNDAWDLEYNGHNLNRLFADRKNLFRPKFYRLIKDILRFNELAKKNNFNNELTISDFLKQHHFCQWFIEGYILPMGAAIWSMSTAQMMGLPLGFFVTFFNNHGLLDIKNRPQWYTVCGGSSSYIPALIKKFSKRIHVNTPISRIIRHSQQVELRLADGESRYYDQVICACHADQALALLADPTEQEKVVLGAIQYSENSVTLHTDTRLLPRRKLAHASWNYWINSDNDALPKVTYNMNILQGLHSPTTYCVSLNADAWIEPTKIRAQFQYAHPIYSQAAVAAQDHWSEISGVSRVHYCGAYWGNGFHEDGVVSAQRVCQWFEQNHV